MTRYILQRLALLPLLMVIVYGVAIAPGQDEALLLFICICIDEMSENDRRGPSLL